MGSATTISILLKSFLIITLFSTSAFGFRVGDGSEPYNKPIVTDGSEPSPGPEYDGSSSGTTLAIVYNERRGSIQTYSKPKRSTIQHPNNGPVEDMPAITPVESTGGSKPYLYHGQKPSIEELTEIGGEVPNGNGLQYCILYNNQWCQTPTAYWLDDRTNTIWSVDTAQDIFMYEKYPDGKPSWDSLGRQSKGYHTGWFSADVRGWHQLAIWGSKSGWSNLLWIYVG